MKEGDILRVTKACNTREGGDVLLGKVAWARMTGIWSSSRYIPRVEWIQPKLLGIEFLNPDLDEDEFTVAEDDDVPDEIWAELARMRLVGDAA